jgi:uncharacterized protein YjiS (DUF1127 family)
MAYTPQTRALRDTSLGLLSGLWPALAARIAWYRAYRRTLEELSQLSDRDLADMGMHRSTLAEVAREAADRA